MCICEREKENETLIMSFRDTEKCFSKVMDFKLSTKCLPLKLEFSMPFSHSLQHVLHEVHICIKWYIAITSTLAKRICSIRVNNCKCPLVPLAFACVSVKALWLCPALCEPVDCKLPARLLCPYDSPGKNTRVGCHALLQDTCLGGA